MNTQANFRREQSTLLHRIHTPWRFALTVGIYAAALFSSGKASASDISLPTATAPQDTTLTPTAPYTSVFTMTVGGYAEYKDPFGLKNHWITQDQAKYLADKAELEAAMDVCVKNPAHHDPRVRELMHMIEKGRRIPDQLTQAQLVTAWFNIKIKYDDNEKKVAKTDLDHRSLLQALREGKTVCDGQSALKLFVLEKLGFDQSSIRWMGEKTYLKGKTRGGHAIVLVRIEKQLWAMDHQPLSIKGKRISRTTARNEMIVASTLEPVATHFNFSGKSFTAIRGVVAVPDFSYNSTQVFFFDSHGAPHKDLSNVPKAAHHAKEKTTSLTLATMRKYNLSRIMDMAFFGHYTLVADKKKNSPSAKKPAPSPTPENANEMVSSRPVPVSAKTGNIGFVF